MYAQCVGEWVCTARILRRIMRMWYSVYENWLAIWAYIMWVYVYVMCARAIISLLCVRARLYVCIYVYMCVCLHPVCENAYVICVYV